MSGPRVVYAAQVNQDAELLMRAFLEEAYILASAIVDVKISQLVDPLLTVRAEIDLSRLY